MSTKTQRSSTATRVDLAQEKSRRLVQSGPHHPRGLAGVGGGFTNGHRRKCVFIPPPQAAATRAVKYSPKAGALRSAIHRRMKPALLNRGTATREMRRLSD